VEVVPGEWHITVRAYGYKNGDAATNAALGPNFLRGMGSKTVNVQGPTRADILMITVTEVSSWAELYAANDGSSSTRREIFLLKANAAPAAWEANTTAIGIARDITFITDEHVTITRASTFLGGPIFWVHAAGRLTLGQPDMAGTLELNGGNVAGATEPLVSLDDTPAVMYSRVTLADNTFGGLMLDGAGASFTMYGGTIRDNTDVRGVGV
jgi:hypothetical protein